MKPAALIALTLAVAATTATAVDYKSQIAPIFQAKCFDCHSETKKVKGKLALDDEKIPEIIAAGKLIVASKVKESALYEACALPDDDDAVMPPKGKNRLTADELKLLETWITEGANIGGGAPAPATAAAGGPQKWTSTDGKVIDATFVRLEGDNVVLTVTASGTTHAVPLARLSPESQAQAKAAK